MACKITKSLDNKICNYAEAGISEMFIANWYKAVELTGAAPVGGEVPVAGQIGYRKDTDGYVIAIVLPPDEVFYRIGGAMGTMSYADQLLAGANGAKYRQQTANAILTQDDIDTISEGDALSLGKYIVIPVAKNGNVKVLGRTSGLEAPAAGWDYASGAAAADANGWTMILQGTSSEIAPLLLDESVVTPIDPVVEVEP